MKITTRSRLKDFMAYYTLRGLILILLIFVGYGIVFWILSGLDDAVFAKVFLLFPIPASFAFLFFILIVFHMGYNIQVEYMESYDDIVLIHCKRRELLLNSKNVYDIRRLNRHLPIVHLRHQPKEGRKVYNYLLLLDDNGIEFLLNWWEMWKKPKLAA